MPQKKTQKSNVFDDLARGSYRMSYAPRTIEAQNYYRRKAQAIKGLTPSKLISTADKDRVVPSIGSSRDVIGQMVMFRYDPKTKATLPYYDMFPLIFILKPLSDGFLGMNFHYLNYRWRGILLNRLSVLASDKRYDWETKLQLSYQLLNNTARFKPFKPCLKRYLNSHVRSQFLWVPSHDWEIAVFLPVQKFIGASEQKVWADSQQVYK